MLLRIRLPDVPHALLPELIVYDGIDAEHDRPRGAWWPTFGRGPSALPSRTTGAQDGDAAHLLRGPTDDDWGRQPFRRYPPPGRTRLYPQRQALVHHTTHR